MPIKRLAERIRKWRSGPPYDIAENEIEYVSLADLPSWEELERRAIAWPLDYRIMLNPLPLEGHDLFVERKEAYQTLSDTLQHWHDGFAPMLALVGPDGGGRTSLLNWFETHLPMGETVTRITVTRRVRTVDELLEWLRNAFSLTTQAENIETLIAALNECPAQIVILDDLQRLLLRSMGTATVMHALLAVLLATQKRFFWIVSCREYGWRLLNAQFSLSRYFSPEVHLGYFRQEELREAVEHRLNLAGLGREDPPEAGDDSESLLDNRNLQGYLNASGGNMRTALFYWQLYSHYDEAQKQLLPRKGKRVELASLRDRGALDRFTLAEVIINGGLSVQEHAEIFQRDPLKSRVVLEQLHRLRLLEKSDTDEGPFYQLDPVFFIPVTAMLESAHVLY